MTRFKNSFKWDTFFLTMSIMAGFAISQEYQNISPFIISLIIIICATLPLLSLNFTYKLKSKATILSSTKQTIYIFTTIFAYLLILFIDQKHLGFAIVFPLGISIAISANSFLFDSK